MILNDLKEKLNTFSLIKLSENNIEDVFELMGGNEYYYSKVQFHKLQIEECIQDLYALPPNTTMNQKFYYGLYQQGQLIAIIDFIEGYPVDECVYIGLFMMHHNYHGKQLAQSIIANFKAVAQCNGFEKLALGCYEDNVIGHRFWKRMGFKTIDKIKNDVDGHTLQLLKMECNLKE